MGPFLRAPWLLVAGLAPLPGQAAGVGDRVPECAAAAAHPRPGAGLDGRVVLVDFWATWCPSCRRSMPFLNRLRGELHEQGFEVLAVNVDEDPQEASRYLATHPVDYPVLFDPTGSCPGAFGVKVMPSSYLIGKDGRIRDIHEGFREGDEASIRQRVHGLLGESP